MTSAFPEAAWSPTSNADAPVLYQRAQIQIAAWRDGYNTAKTAYDKCFDELAAGIQTLDHTFDQYGRPMVPMLDVLKMIERFGE